MNIDSIFKHVATEAYRTSESNQLSFPQGAILSVIEKCEDGMPLELIHYSTGVVDISSSKNTLLDLNDILHYNVNVHTFIQYMHL